MGRDTIAVDKFQVFAVPYAEKLLQAIAERDGIGSTPDEVKAFVSRHTVRTIKLMCSAVRDAVEVAQKIES
jgi:hypothetical protein